MALIEGEEHSKGKTYVNAQASLSEKTLCTLRSQERGHPEDG